MVYYEKAVHNYFIPCHRKKIQKPKQCDMRAEIILNDFELALQSFVQDRDTSFIKRFQNGH